MYESRRSAFATLLPRSFDCAVPSGPLGPRILSLSIHHCDHCEILSPLILCWRGCQSPSCCCCPLANGFMFVACPWFFVALWPDCQRLVELNHLAAARGQIDPNDESIARCRRAFCSTRCDLAQLSCCLDAVARRGRGVVQNIAEHIGRLDE